jgi:DNA-binding transcriptional MocR family regulator|eukprot:COSAG06_NODE_703_length_12909_cov_33.909758_3_plen_147_part_00
MTLAAQLLKSWGLPRYHEQMKTVKAFYHSRREVMQAAAAKHLDGLAEWTVPSAGMFFWFDLSPSGVTDSAPLILEKARDALVLLAPGSAFATTDGPSCFARAAYSIASDDVIDESLRRLASVLRDAKAENEEAAAATAALAVAGGQ